jgi:hypothetical protein
MSSSDHPDLVHLLAPQRIPTRSVVRADIPEVWFSDLGYVWTRGRQRSHRGAGDALLALRDRLPPLLPPLVQSQPPTASVGLPLIADDAGHDQYFCLRRVPGPPGVAFVRSILTGAALFHSEIGANYDPSDTRFGAVDAGFDALLASLVGINLAPIDYPDPDVHASPASFNPIHRWRLGHQIFATLTHGLIFSLQVFETASNETDARQARKALLLSADLLMASAGAFRFTTDFPSEAYRDVVRPSMMAPNVSDGFSGLLSVDHRHLIAVLTRLRPLMSAAAVRFAAEHARLTAALNQVYDDHKFVCARFVGAEKPSLRCPRAVELSGVEQLERYQRARIGLLAPGSGPEPVDMG